MARVESPQIVPAILAGTIDEYNRMIKTTSRFAKRLSLDFSDGEFAPSQTINPIQAHWPPGPLIDIHLMYARPLEELETLISLNPHLVVVHAEAEGDLASFMGALSAVGIKAGLGLLAPTRPEAASELVARADHVLIFSGRLGFYGGQFDEGLLSKVAAIRAIKPELEIAWDGGVNESNAGQIAQAGVDVLNVGGYIQNAPDPKSAYTRLEAALKDGQKSK